MKEGEGYFLIFRENNEEKKFKLNTWLKENDQVRLTPLLQEGRAYEVKAGAVVEFSLDKPNSYRLYHYQVVDSSK